MHLANQKYYIEAVKRRTGATVAGTTEWDGLSSVYAVETESGEVEYVSVLDDITVFRPVPA